MCSSDLDLTSYRTGRTVLASPYIWRYRAGKAARRHPALVTLISAVLVFALAGAVSWETDRAFLADVATRTGAPVYVSGDLFMEDPAACLADDPFLAGVLTDFTSDELARHLSGLVVGDRVRLKVVRPGGVELEVTAASGAAFTMPLGPIHVP